MSATKIKRYTPSSGDTITLENFDTSMTVIIAPTANIASLTIVWPTIQQNGQTINFLFTKNVTTITHSGAILNIGFATMAGPGVAAFQWDAVGNVFMCNGILLGNAVVPLSFTVSVAGGTGDAVFYATDSGLVGGNALFASIQNVQPSFDVADPLKAYTKPVVSNGNKTITTNCKIMQQNLVTVLGISVVGSTTLVSVANGIALTVLIHGVLA